MSDVDGQNRPHIVLRNNATSEDFTSPGGGGGGSDISPRNRNTHGRALLNQIKHLEPAFADAVENQREAGIDDGLGLLIEFESFADVELAFESLARERSGIELRNVRADGSKTFATVFVPDGKLEHFEKLIKSYLDPAKDGKKGPSGQKLLNAISGIRAAMVKALWTDSPDLLPARDSEEIWWEVWLPVRGDRTAVAQSFREMATSMEFKLAEGELNFPERTVVHMYGSLGQVKRSMMALNHIAELRRAKETAEFFDDLPPEEQSDWVEDLSSRLAPAAMGSDVPYICVLDTGINNGHPLLMPFLANIDTHSVDPAWGVDDSQGHGTEMAGISLFGNLNDKLIETTPLEITHRLESVKLLPQDGENSNDPVHHGHLTVEAVQRPLVTAPDRLRVFSMAVTAKDNRDRGRPSAWSSAIDRLASDAEAQGESPKLFVLSAGNISDPSLWAEYPNSNTTESIHDPAQAWNALTVGAMTDLCQITEDVSEDYKPIAPDGGLSPFSTTSQTWQAHWPLKPDVVFEGGNAAHDGLGAVTMPSLSLLTTNYEPTTRLLATTNATSAATALGARMSAELMAGYKDLWPETIRGLIVHSARWTPAMLDTFLPAGRKPRKTEVAQLVRHCGFGVPDLQRALWSANDSLTLISEASLNPFTRTGSAAPKYREMNFHQLPWPLDELEALGDHEVEMRVSLSYFIEPNPSARGVRSRYRYESHGLRFDVKRPVENEQQFRSRLNVAAGDEEEGTPSTGVDKDWMLGKNNRHRGSMHSDSWRGSAAELASRGMIGVYPAMGWWKSRLAQERYNSAARYSLIVSIHVADVDVDIYTPVATKIGLEIEV